MERNFTTTVFENSVELQTEEIHQAFSDICILESLDQLPMTRLLETVQQNPSSRKILPTWMLTYHQILWNSSNANCTGNAQYPCYEFEDI